MFAGRATLDGSLRKAVLMKLFSTLANLFRSPVVIFPICWFGLATAHAQLQNGTQQPNTECRVEPVDYKGWHAQQLSNRWVQLVMVPQNGGRVIQVTFAGHPYLFVNPQLAGKYFPPTNGKWFNYGGDKIWLLPEGNDDEQHWVGNSDILDDGPFTFRKLSEGKQCEIELTGPADPQTGIQFVRTIRLDRDSPRIRFHVLMKNISGHTVNWSMQSVSQYNTSDPSSPNRLNRNFWSFAPANPSSSYLIAITFASVRPRIQPRRCAMTGFSLCIMSTWRLSCGSTLATGGWRSSTAAATTRWSSASSMKPQNLIPARLPSCFGPTDPRQG